MAGDGERLSLRQPDSPGGQGRGRLPVLTSDGWLLFGTSAIRSTAYGFVSVMLGLYLASLGYDIATIGAIFAAVLAGDVAITILLTQVADRLGRRRVLVVGATLMVLAGVVR